MKNKFALVAAAEGAGQPGGGVSHSIRLVFVAIPLAAAAALQ